MSKAGANYTYDAQNANCQDGALSKAHAVVTAGSSTYCYDQNGNMVQRNVGGSTFYLTFDAENRLTQVTGAALAAFSYSGDGERVLGTENGVTTIYIGNYFEWNVNTSAMTKYYNAGSERVAMKVGTNDPTWLLGDHLGSTSVAANNDGSLLARQGYKAWGEQRFPTGASPLPTTFRYTGQREASSIELYFYGARWYDASLGRWISPDLIIPIMTQGLQALDRYAYGSNNPSRFIDPSGHIACEGAKEGHCDPDHGLDYSIWLKRALRNPHYYAERFNVNFIGFTQTQIGYILMAVYEVAFKMGVTTSTNPWDAFNNNYSNGTITFEKGMPPPPDGCHGPCPTNGGFTQSSTHVWFDNLGNNQDKAILNVIHELGHAFDHTPPTGDTNISVRYSTQINNVNGIPPNYNGFAQGYFLTPNPNDPSNSFANMFVGWVTGEWAANAAGTALAGNMNAYMVGFLK